MKFSLDIKKTPAENAQFYYEKSKKAKKKLEGAKKALQETLWQIEKLKEKKIFAWEKEKEKIKLKEVKEKKFWYEKFRYFFSSDNFLVIGGKDANSNEVIIKKHLEKNDLVFHADILGAPFFIIKNPENKQIPEETLKETAQMAASYSKAWKLGLNAIDVYFVKPEQVSKTPPSGQYLEKGSFMIYGRKEWFRNTELKIAVGVAINENIEVIGGPSEAVNKTCKYFAEIKPGYKKSKELAEEIKKFILRKSNKEDGERIKKISLEEFQKWVPSGKGEIS